MCSCPQCFFEEVSKGEKVVGSYWVAEGGNLDVDLRVLGPDGKIVYERERTQDGSFQFKAQAEGETTARTTMRGGGAGAMRRARLSAGWCADGPPS